LIVAEARRWIGTPYRHQASLIGVGCDCLGLVRGIWRAVVGRDLFIRTVALRGAFTAAELMNAAELALARDPRWLETHTVLGVDFGSLPRPEMLAALLERTQLTAGLRRAVELGQITVHYQPVVSTEQLEVVQFEALARWQWEGQLMPPDQFIQTAERSGLIREIGAEVLRRSCTELQPWLAEDPRRTLAVNVSGVQLQHPDFAERVLDIAAWSGVDPHQLVLEVTESVFFDAQCHVITQLVTLRAAGIRVALDDFGTGYSSLGRLQELPVDIVKIDKSFVSMLRTGTEKLPILTSMIHMARSLGLKVTAEGIETPEQARYLMDHGCDALQGYRQDGLLNRSVSFGMNLLINEGLDQTRRVGQAVTGQWKFD